MRMVMMMTLMMTTPSSCNTYCWFPDPWRGLVLDDDDDDEDDDEDEDDDDYGDD